MKVLPPCFLVWLSLKYDFIKLNREDRIFKELFYQAEKGEKQRKALYFKGKRRF